MQHIPPVAEQMQRLLEPVSPLWIAERLGVTPQTVNHWKRGRHVSERRLQEAADAIRQLLPEHDETAPPQWAERLTERILAAIREERDALAEQMIRKTTERVAAGWLGLPTPDESALDSEDR